MKECSLQLSFLGLHRLRCSGELHTVALPATRTPQQQGGPGRSVAREDKKTATSALRLSRSLWGNETRLPQSPLPHSCHRTLSVARHACGAEGFVFLACGPLKLLMLRYLVWRRTLISAQSCCCCRAPIWSSAMGPGAYVLLAFKSLEGDGRPAPSVRPSRRRLNPASLQRRDFNTDGLILYYLQGGAVPLLHELSFSDTTFAILDNKAGAPDLSARGVLTSNRRSELSARRAKELEMLSKTSLARSKKLGSVTTASRTAVYSRFLSQRRFCLLQDLSELHHCNGHQGIPLHMQPQLFYRTNGYDLLSPRRKLVCQALCREDFSVS